MSATGLVCAAPSQLRRSSAARISSVAAAHKLRRGRDVQNERDGAGLRSSVAATTPSQLRRSSAGRALPARLLSARRRSTIALSANSN